MHILVINGSPKGKNSITLHTALYLEKKFPADTFSHLHVGQQIKALEKNFSPAMEALEKADLLLFCYPVYTFLAPYQLARFIELMVENKAPVAGKLASQITTSKHFYDVTAHAFIQDNCRDLQLHYIPGLSADMEDLTTPRGRQEAEDFWKRLHWQASQGYYAPQLPLPPATPLLPVTAVEETAATDGDVVIVADILPGDTQIPAMIARFRARLPYRTRVVNIREYPFLGGCLGCFRCASTGKCIYSDGFDEFLRKNIQNGDAIVYAFSISHHAMGSRFKMYDDRQFCNGHRTVTIGMPVGYLVSGNLSREQNLRLVLEARAEVGGNVLCGIATDEEDPDAAIDRLAATVCYALSNKVVQPRNFYGVGGMKIFRDLIYQMRGMMRADHKFFKSHEQYDFPQKKFGQSMLMYLVGAMNASPKIQKKLGSKMTEGMVAPYKKVLDETK